MSDDKLIRMANQIAAFQASQPGDTVATVAGHLNDFWAPAMRARLVALATERGAEFHPLVQQAVTSLRLPAD